MGSLIFVRSLTPEIDLPEIRGEFGLLIAAGRHNPLWRHDITPGPQPRRLVLPSTAMLDSFRFWLRKLFIEFHAEDLGQLPSARRPRPASAETRRQQSRNAVNGAVSVIRREVGLSLVGPFCSRTSRSSKRQVAIRRAEDLS